MAAATMATNKYTFEDSTAPTYELKSSYHRGGRGRKNSYDDENGSLTYSAASSINSKESTDSSFAEIRRAFEAGGDSKELAAFLKRHNMRADGSIAGESLAYSTDAESHLRYGGGADSLAYSADNESYYNRSMATDLGSHLQGSDIVSGQNSAQHSDQYSSVLGASYVNNGGGQRFEPGEDDLALMFAPAEHTEGMKRRKERKRREKRERMLSASNKPPAPASADREVNTSHASSTATPKASGNSSSGSSVPVRLKLPDDDANDFDFPSNTSNAQRVVTPSRTPRESRQGTPPSARPPKANTNPARKGQETNELPDDDADVWYGKWWMFCFPDLKPKWV